MKRGRPIIRYDIQNLIIEHLKNIQTPVSINAICRLILKQTGKKFSWNTVQKYLQELVEFNKVEAISTSHSKIEGKTGLTVYQLKR